MDGFRRMLWVRSPAFGGSHPCIRPTLYLRRTGFAIPYVTFCATAVQGRNHGRVPPNVVGRVSSIRRITSLYPPLLRRTGFAIPYVTFCATAVQGRNHGRVPPNAMGPVASIRRITSLYPPYA